MPSPQAPSHTTTPFYKNTHTHTHTRGRPLALLTVVAALARPLFGGARRPSLAKNNPSPLLSAPSHLPGAVGKQQPAYPNSPPLPPHTPPHAHPHPVAPHPLSSRPQRQEGRQGGVVGPGRRLPAPLAPLSTPPLPHPALRPCKTTCTTHTTRTMPFPTHHTITTRTETDCLAATACTAYY